MPWPARAHSKIVDLQQEEQTREAAKQQLSGRPPHGKLDSATEVGRSAASDATHLECKQQHAGDRLLAHALQTVGVCDALGSRAKCWDAGTPGPVAASVPGPKQHPATSTLLRLANPGAQCPTHLEPPQLRFDLLPFHLAQVLHAELPPLCSQGAQNCLDARRLGLSQAAHLHGLCVCVGNSGGNRPASIG